MRLTKMFGLAALAAVAAMSFVGVSSALALEHEGIGLCKAEELILCAAGNLITPKAGDTLIGTQEGVGKFTGSLIGTEECTSGSATATPSTTVDKKTYTVSNMAFTFSGCTPCTKVTVATIPTATVSMGTVLGKDWTLKGSGAATFSGCPFGATCEFGGSEVSTLIEMGEGKSWVNTAGTGLKFVGGSGGEFLCGKEGKWFAKFNLSYKLASGTVDNVVPTLLEAK